MNDLFRLLTDGIRITINIWVSGVCQEKEARALKNGKQYIYIYIVGAEGLPPRYIRFKCEWNMYGT